MKTTKSVIVGASAPDTVKLINAINRAGQKRIVVEGFLDDDVAKHGSHFMGIPVLGPISLLATTYRGFGVVNNIARDMTTRQAIVARINEFPSEVLTLVHPSVDASHCRIGAGCLVQEGVILGANSVVGDHCMLYASCVIGHEALLADFVFVANKVIVGARTRIGTGSFLGLGSVIVPYVEVGSWCAVGAGSVVLRPLAAGSAVFGNPARAGVQPVTLEVEASANESQRVR